MRDCHRSSLAVIGAIVLSIGACRLPPMARETLVAFRDIQQDAAQQIGSRDVNVNFNNGRSLAIVIANSPTRDLPAGQKRQRALAVAKRAYGRLAPIAAVDAVTVTWSVRRTYVGFISAFRVDDGLTFRRDELAETSAETVSTDRWIPPLAPPFDLYVVAIGDVPAALLDDLVSRVDTKFGVRVRVLPRLLFDRATFDRARSQFSADELILAIRRRYATVAADSRARVIGVTRGDMYMETLANQWQFTFSLRSEDNRFAVVSYARMDPAALDGRPDAERLSARLRKMVLKNVGILCYGLPISKNSRSALYGQIDGIDDLDRVTDSFDPE